ncbi:OmpA family protein [Rhodoferax sp.]|uniref:OmpA family protein n=1 Tax=Rhodoferax sp. TaxID=50421 RepID=UPI0025DEA0C9|nr:OmpA family protein [Rhodoferax sp.]
MLPSSQFIFGGLMALGGGLALAADAPGYVLDSRGEPLRSAAGGCIRTGNWSAQSLHAACDALPDRIVLLPGPDGKLGAVVVRSAAGEVRLDSAYAAAQVTQAGAIAQGREDAATVAGRFGAVLAAQPPRPVSFTVYFATGSATELAPESLAVMDGLRAELAQRPAPEIMVIGHTDRVGNEDANDTLSASRAQTVKDMLVASGAKAISLDVIGRGEREPLVATADGVAEPRNRRVEISVR